MTKRTLSLLAVLAAAAAPIAHAETGGDTPAYTIVLAGGTTQNKIHIWLSPDGYDYVIESAAPLEVGGDVCQNPPGNLNELTCEAPIVAGFVVNGGPVDDAVTVSSSVTVPVTLRGGAGNDVLAGGAGADKLIGGSDDDRLFGRGGDDIIYGGSGNDVLFGGSGNDALWGGSGQNALHPGTGKDSLH